jgi:cytoskeletal protein RodZ
MFHTVVINNRAAPRLERWYLMNDEQSVLGLSTIRRNRGISLQEIAASTKISIRSLEAIERGEFRKLPGGIYNTSYIRQYARAIDYDESAILSVYYREMAVKESNSDQPKNGKGPVGLRPLSTILGL